MFTTPIDAEAQPGRPSFQWDTNTAFAALVLGSFLFLMMVNRGFRGFNVSATVS